MPLLASTYVLLCCTAIAGGEVRLGPVDEREDLPGDDLGVLEHDEVARVADDDVLGAGEPLDDLLALRRRREQVALAVDDEHLRVDERARVASSSWRLDRLDERRHDLEPRREDEVGR